MNGLTPTSPEQNVRGMATTLCERAETIYNAAILTHKVVKYAVTEGERATCGAITLGYGLSTIFALNPIVGIPTALIGAHQIWKTFQTSDHKEEVKRLLDDSKAANDMVKTLSDSNKQALAVVKGQTDIIQTNMQDIKKRLNEIESLATGALDADEMREIDRDKQAAIKACLDVEQQFRYAEKILMRSQKRIQSSQESMHDKILVGFEELFAIPKKEGDGKELSKEFMEKAHILHKECKKVASTIDSGNLKLEAGIQLLNNALVAQKQAIELTTKVTTRVEVMCKNHQERLELIKEKANADKQIERSEKSLEIIHKQLDRMDVRMKRQQQLIEISNNNIKEAQAKIDDKFGMETLFFGGGAGAILGGLIYGPVIGAPAGMLAGAELYHNRKAVFSGAEKVRNVVMGYETAPDLAKPFHVENRLKLAFANRSTSIWGRLCGRESKTAGKLEIKIHDNKTISCDFDLNRKEPLTLQDMNKLYQELLIAMQNEKISPKECVAIISQLETIKIDRGTSYAPVVGIIPKDFVVFEELKDICNDLAEARELYGDLITALKQRDMSPQECIDTIDSLEKAGSLSKGFPYLKKLKTMCENQMAEDLKNSMLFEQDIERAFQNLNLSVSVAA